MIERLAFALLCAVVFSLPWEKSVVLAGAGTLTKWLGVAAFACGGAAALARREVRGLNVALGLAVMFSGWSAASWFWSYDPAVTLARAITYAMLLALVWLVWDLCRTGEHVDWLLAMYVGGATVASIATIARYAMREQTYYRRYAAPGFDPNDLGITVALAIPMALYVSAQAGPLRAWCARVAAALCCVAILLTASRTSVIAAFAGVLFVAFTWRASARAHRVASVALVAILPLGLLWLAPKASRERIATTTTEITRGTLHKRTEIWKAGVRALKRHPLVGYGAGAYPDAVQPWLGVPPVAGHEYVAHNTFLSVLVETGAVGAVLYGALLLALAAFVWVLPQTQRALWAMVFLVWAIGASTLTWEQRKPWWLVLGLVMASWAHSFRPTLSK